MGNPARTQPPATDWRDLGNCRSADPALFFGAENETGPERAAREATTKAICDPCPVRTDCLEFALSRPAQHGVWGGLNEDERAAERRRRMRRAANAARAAREAAA